MEGSIEKMIVDKAKLLETVKINKEKYKELNKLAIDNYWKLAEVKLTKMLERVKNKRKIDGSLNISLPVDHLEDYDLVIKMLEFSEDIKISLTPQEFSKYVLNKWNWRSEFVYTVTSLARGFSGYSGLSGYSGHTDSDGEDIDEETYEFLQMVDNF